MARIRTIKPELAKHEILFELEQQLGCAVRFAWAMLFTQCDREGRFKWRPRPLKLDILPYDDCDFSRVLDAWVTRGLLVKYRVGNEWFGCIPTFSKHQQINNRESESQIPGIDEADEVVGQSNQQDIDASVTRQSRDEHASVTRYEGKGKEGKGREDASTTRKKPLPKDFTISDQVRKWAKEKNHSRLDEHLEHFTDTARARGYKYADWDAAFKRAIRENWAKLDGESAEWNATASGIESKAIELGINPADFDGFPALKAEVFRRMEEAA